MPEERLIKPVLSELHSNQLEGYAYLERNHPVNQARMLIRIALDNPNDPFSDRPQPVGSMVQYSFGLDSSDRLELLELADGLSTEPNVLAQRLLEREIERLCDELPIIGDVVAMRVSYYKKHNLKRKIAGVENRS